VVLRRPRRSDSTAVLRRRRRNQISPLDRPNLTLRAAGECLSAFALALSHGSALAENRLTHFTLIFAFALAGTDLTPLITQLSKNEQTIPFYVLSGFRVLNQEGRNQQHRK
jgi:hypothetical protein